MGVAFSLLLPAAIIGPLIGHLTPVIKNFITCTFNQVVELLISFKPAKCSADCRRPMHRHPSLEIDKFTGQFVLVKSNSGYNMAFLLLSMHSIAL